MNLSEQIISFCESEYFLFIDSEIKDFSQSILSVLVENLDDNYSIKSFENALLKIQQLDLSLNIKKKIPNLLNSFFEYLETCGYNSCATICGTVNSVINRVKIDIFLLIIINIVFKTVCYYQNLIKKEIRLKCNYEIPL